MLGSARREEISRWRTSPLPPLPLPASVAAPRPRPRRRRSRPAERHPLLRPALLGYGRASRGGVRGIGLVGLVGLLLGLVVLVRLQQVRGVEEGALLLADVDEGRLDTGQHRLDPTQVDIADGAAMVRPVHQELD